jgi:hypothetical protein
MELSTELSRNDASSPVGVEHKGHRNRKYPWEEWTDGETHTIARGVDFKVPLYVLRNQLFQRAYRLGMKVYTNKLDEDTLTFKFYDDQDLYDDLQDPSSSP